VAEASLTVFACGLKCVSVDKQRVLYHTHKPIVHYAQGVLLAWQVSDVPLKFRIKDFWCLPFA